MTFLLVSLGLTLAQIDPTKDDLASELAKAKATLQCLEVCSEAGRVYTASIERKLEILKRTFIRDRAKFDEQTRGQITHALQGIEDNLRRALEKQKLLAKTKSEADSLLAEAERLKERDKTDAVVKARAIVAKEPAAQLVMKAFGSFIRSARAFVAEAEKLIQM